MSKKKKKNKNKPQKDENFGLVPPTGKLDDATETFVSTEMQDESKPKPKTAAKDSDSSYKQMAWKGFEPEEVDPDPMLTFGEKGDREEDDLDMTPMVDVTFLLLIFFMVTASFTLQKSIQQPPAQSDDPSPTVVDPQDEDQYVEVIIDQNNSYYVTSKDEEEVEAPSDREMRAQMRDAKTSSGATRLIIRAHVDSMHRKLVTAWDAGIAAGMEQIEVRTTDEDF